MTAFTDIRSRVARDDGLSLAELLIATALMSIIVGTTYLVLTTGQGIANHTESRVIVTDEVRLGLDRMATELRQAEELVDADGSGTGVFATAEARRAVFFADVDRDGSPERISYFVDGTTIRRSVAEPATTPVDRTTAWQTDSTPAPILEGLSPSWTGAIFTYRGVGSPAPVLTAASSIPDMSTVQLHVVAEARAGDITSTADETLWVKIRAVQNTIQ